MFTSQNRMNWIYCVLLHVSAVMLVDATRIWNEWWAYQGVSGPAFWGTHIDDWALCESGRYQSPIDIQPKQLIFDPNLTALQYNRIQVDGVLINTGQDLTMEIKGDNPEKESFVFTGGPFSYTYKVAQIKLHFGSKDEWGSEHRISGKQFPLEVQIIGYNTELYKNFTEALLSTHGLAVISLLGAIDDSINLEFGKILTAAKSIKYRGYMKEVVDFSIADIIPPSEFFITYEGSITQPSCQETVTWVLINKPLHITKDQIIALRELNKWPHEDDTHTPLAENNFRPTKPLNRRTVRTNIKPNNRSEEDCNIKLHRSYKVNERLIGL